MSKAKKPRVREPAHKATKTEQIGLLAMVLWIGHRLDGYSPDQFDVLYWQDVGVDVRKVWHKNARALYNALQKVKES
jgi:hypothetical protein